MHSATLSSYPISSRQAPWLRASPQHDATLVGIAQCLSDGQKQCGGDDGGPSYVTGIRRRSFAQLLSKLQSANDAEKQAAIAFAIDSLLMAVGSIEHRLDALEQSNDMTRRIPGLVRRRDQ